MNQNQIVLKISNVSQKLKSQFPNDPKGDVQIVLKSKRFQLQKAYLRMNSEYFKKLLDRTTNYLSITQEYQQDQFQRVLSLLYGNQVTVERSKIQNYYHILKDLEIQCVLKFVRDDILSKIENYYVFQIMSIANKVQDQELFSFCWEQLEKQNYQQIIYSQNGLLHLELPLLKLVLKSHNKFKKDSKTEISYVKINQLLSQYCSINQLNNDKFNEIKFQIFDLTSLTSQDYKHIFVFSILQQDQQQNFEKSKNLIESLTFKQEKKSSLTPKQKKKSLKGSRLLGSIQIKTQNQLKLQMIITFLRKRIQQIKLQNDFLTQQLENIKKITSANQDIHKQMEKDIKFLKQQLARKQSINQEHRRIINKIEPLMAKLQRQIQKKTQQIDRLVLQHQKKSMQKTKPKTPPSNTQQTINHHSAPKTPQQDFIVQSQFLSANFIHQMFSGNNEQTPTQQKGSSKPVHKVPVPKKQSKNHNKQQPKKQKLAVIQSLNEEQIQELYSHRIQFVQQPVSVNKMDLPKLCKMLANDFNKKSLSLIYRRSQKLPPKGSKLDIRNRKSLLILIHTEYGKRIGGYLSSQIPQQKVTYVKDENAYIFSLTQNKKMPINPSDAADAIYINDNYLLSFSNDLMIANDCLTQKSNCFWPNSYCRVVNKEIDKTTWLAGNTQFLIKDLQIYQINDVEMEMVL